jgi:hypothetical protein
VGLQNTIIESIKLCKGAGIISIVTGYELDNRDSIPTRGKSFSLCHHIQTGFWACPTSYPMSTGGGGFKAEPGCEADHSYPSNSKVKNMLSYTFTPPYTFMV